MKLADITALVTGANRGLGRAFVTELLALGVGRVYAGVRRPETVAEAFPGESRVVALPLDLTDLDSIARGAAAVPELNLLINNAATLERGDLLAVDALAILDRAWLTNVRGPLAVARGFAPALLRSCPESALVQINSIAALCPFADVPAYAATKAAALSITQALRREFNSAGLPVFSVLPGVLNTAMAAWLDCAKTDPRAVARAVLTAVQSHSSLDLFPDEGAQSFWTSFTADPAATLFVAPTTR